MWWRGLLGLAFTGLIIWSFVSPAPQQQIGESSRIFYYHVPQAWICSVAFLVAALFGGIYLRSRNPKHDDASYTAALLGFIACILATITGAVFAKVTWGTYWNWDPRQTSIFLLLLIYAAYFALREAVDQPERRSRLSAVYSVFAFVTVPFLVFIIPRMTESLHPSDSIIGNDLKFNISGEVAAIFASSMVLFSALYVWLFAIGRRFTALRRQRDEALLEQASA